MGIRYDSKMLIKMQAKIKEQAEEKAESLGKTLSSYVRDLIVNDIKGE